MANLKLKNQNGEEVTYEDRGAIRIPNTSGGYTEFVESGSITPVGDFQIDGTLGVGPYPVANYETATVTDSHLTAENIRKDVTILGVTGTYPNGGTKNITSTGLYNVENYESAQIVDDNLIPSNIAEGVTILGVTGTHSSCVASGTMITMANGSKKPIEEITLNDSVMVFNHETGCVEPSGISFIEDEGLNHYDVINLKWSNGQVSRIIDEHGFFDLDLMKYVYLHNDDFKEYIGHRFYTGVYDNSVYTPSEVTLEDAYLTHEYTGCYSFPSVYHLNFYIEDMLSMPGGITGMFNIFEYEHNLQYNLQKKEEDISEYGLFDYANVEGQMSYKAFCKCPSEYLNVALQKGVMTQEQLLHLINRYGKKI